MDHGRLSRTCARHCWVLGLWSFWALAGTPQLVRDINAHVIPINSSPTDFLDFGARSFFDAADSAHGYEPWSTDGTAAGTYRLGDLQEGPTGTTGRQPVLAGGRFFFANNPLGGTPEIWVEDPAQQSAHRISTPEVAQLVNLTEAGAVGNTFLFSGFNPGTGVRELWASDGTEGGTRFVPGANGESYTSAFGAFSVGSKLYFFSIAPGNIVEPWVTDGTQAGTRRLGPIANAAQSDFSRFSRVGNFVLFAYETTDAGTELWRIDVRDDSLARVTDIATGTASALRPSELLRSVNGVAIFNASASGDDTRTTWRSDGTAAGTFQIANVAMLDDPDSPYLGASDVPRLLFRVLNGANDIDTWTTDGSIANTALLRNFSPVLLQRCGHRYYFLGIGDQPWTSDGTDAGTKMLSGIVANGAHVRDMAGTDTTLYVRTSNLGTGLDGGIYKHVVASGVTTLLTTYSLTDFGLPHVVFTVAQGQLYFDNEDAVHGRELWISDGTPAGTRLLENLAPELQTHDSAPADFARFNDVLYFTADDGDHGRELWKSDGTEAGTVLFFDARPGPTGSEPTALFAALNRLFFFARDGAGVFRLWSWDGTATPPQPLAASAPLVNFSAPSNCNSTGDVLNGHVLLRAGDANGAIPTRLWTTDGTSAGTRIIADLGAGTGGSCERIVFDNRLYFQGTNGNLWVSDGTSAEPFLQVGTGPIGSFPRDLSVRNGKLYFLADDLTHRELLWSTNGTVAGTTPVDIFTAGSPRVAYGGIAAGLLIGLIEIENGLFVSRLWTTDGTNATRLSSNLQLTTGRATVNRGKGYFTARVDDSSPITVGLGVTDGTVAGTSLLVDLQPASVAGPFIDFDGVTVFQTNHPSGRQLWRTNGTPTGTRQIADVQLGQSVLAANHTLFYDAFGSGTGTELFALANDRPVAVNDSLGSIQAGTSVNFNVLTNDADADGVLDTSSVRIVTQPSGGSVIVAANGTITYTARGGFAGADSLTYTVADDQAYASTPATVQVTVTAAPAPPTPPAQGGSGGGGGGAMNVVHLLPLLLLLHGRGFSRRHLCARGSRRKA
jgi:ELWxxDGT repeat protein